MEIIDYSSDHAEEIAELYHSTIHSISKKYYSPEQLEAWAKTLPDYKRWRKRLEITPPTLLMKDGRVASFIGFEKNGKIDWLFTHPDYQRQGLATALCSYAEDLTRNRNGKTLRTYASKAAKGFFLEQGFGLVRENQAERNGVALTNYYMVKKLDRHEEVIAPR